MSQGPRPVTTEDHQTRLCLNVFNLLGAAVPAVLQKERSNIFGLEPEGKTPDQVYATSEKTSNKNEKRLRAFYFSLILSK
jgi:hypothetical protein